MPATVRVNLDQMRPLVVAAAAAGSQVVVFPETCTCGARLDNISWTFECAESVPAFDGCGSPTGSGSVTMCGAGAAPVVPCDSPAFDSRPILSALSCMAKGSGVVLAAQMYDRVPGNGSTHGLGDAVYNTAVVFDSSGALVAKYHKAHLYMGEVLACDEAPPFAVHVSPTELGGVTLGVLICYDIQFAEPAASLLRPENGVSTVLFPHNWESSTPYCESPANVQSWAATHRINVVAANSGFNEYFWAGSGLFSGGRAVAHSANPHRSWRTRALSGTLPGERPPPPPQTPPAVPLVPPSGATAFESFHAYAGMSRSIVTSVAGEAVCRFNLSVAADSQTVRQLFGVWAYAAPPGNSYPWNRTLCALERCLHNDPYQCGNFPVWHSNLRLDSLTIELYAPPSSAAVRRFDAGLSWPETRFYRTANNTRLFPLQTGAGWAGRTPDGGFGARLDYARLPPRSPRPSSSCSPPDCFEPGTRDAWLAQARDAGMLATSVYMMEFK